VTRVAFPAQLPDELTEVLGSTGVDSLGREVPFLRGWRLVRCVFVTGDQSVLEVRVVSGEGGELLLRLRADAVPGAYYKPAPGEDPADTDYMPLAVNLGTLVKETVEPKRSTVSTELDLRF